MSEPNQSTMDRGLDWESWPKGMPGDVVVEYFCYPGEMTRLGALARLFLPPMQKDSPGSCLSEAIFNLGIALERAGFGDPHADPSTWSTIYLYCMGAVTNGEDIVITWRELAALPPEELDRILVCAAWSQKEP